MSYPYADEDKDPPPNATVPMTPANGKQRVLLAIVIILGVLIVAAFAVLVVGLIFGTGDRGGSSGKPWQQVIDEPMGSRIVYTQVDGNRVILRVATPRGEEIVLVDAANGKLIGRVEVRPAQ